jgi:Icc-related predicted phosphoesterase
VRIVAVSDTHCCHHEIAVADGDVFVHAGDFLSFGDEVEFREFVTWLRALPHENKIVVAGNHDRFVAGYPIDARAAIADAGAIYLEDELITIDGATFYGSPWTPEFMNWAFMLARGSEIKEKWDRIPDSLDVLITHGPPSGIMDFGLGCEELLKRVFRATPKVHIFGHIHECYGVREVDGIRFINASIMDEQFAITKQPVTIDL